MEEKSIEFPLTIFEPWSVTFSFVLRIAEILNPVLVRDEHVRFDIDNLRVNRHLEVTRSDIIESHGTAPN